MSTPTLRAGLPPLPANMRGLCIDERGYPVPYFVAWVNGKPDHRMVEPRAVQICVQQNRCWLCGQPLGRFKVFTVGPMCAVNRVSGEPPSHRDCAEFAAKACPFLTRPRAQRREANLPEERHVNPAMLEHNPGATLLWTTTSYKTVPTPPRGRVFDMGPAEAMDWYAEGRKATRAEVDAAIERGLPKLLDAAAGDAGGVLEIVMRVAALRQVLDKELPA